MVREVHGGDPLVARPVGAADKAEETALLVVVDLVDGQADGASLVPELAGMLDPLDDPRRDLTHVGSGKVSTAGRAVHTLL